MDLFPSLDSFKSSWQSAVSIVVANAAVLCGILFFSWTLTDMIILYWAESAIIGLFTILKMALARGPNEEEYSKMEINAMGETTTIDLNKSQSLTSKLPFILFFMIHYGGFMFGHLVFLIGLIIPLFGGAESDHIMQILQNVVIGLLLLLASHSVSFAVNYVGKKEYLNASVSSLFAAPYSRIIGMHLFIVLGGLSFALLDPSSSRVIFYLYAIVLIAGKTYLDIAGHLGERDSLSRGQDV